MERSQAGGQAGKRQAAERWWRVRRGGSVDVVCLWRRNRYVVYNGFALAVGFYALQRFVWEFLKPYGTLVGPFTLFHLLSIALLVYAIAMLAFTMAGHARGDGQRPVNRIDHFECADLLGIACQLIPAPGTVPRHH